MRLDNFIVCDLIRQEKTNKYLFVGVYDDNIILTPPPLASAKENFPFFALPLTFFIRFRKTEENEEFPTSFKFVVSFNVEKQIPIEFTGKIRAEKEKNNITISLSFSPFTIPLSTTKIDFKIYLIYSDGRTSEFPLNGVNVLIAETGASSEIKE